MSISLTRFTDAQFKPSKRRTKCKNCCSMFGPKAVNFANGDLIRAHNPRIVVSGGWGPGTRHVSLCPDCATSEAHGLIGLANELLSAVTEGRES